jgi:glutathione S-transferase
MTVLTLYNGATSVCAAKVRVTLSEKGKRKGTDWDGPLLDLHKGHQFDPAYLKLNPNAVVPTLVDDGRVVIESTVINEYLEDIFPEPRLRPADPYGRARMRLWTRQEESVHDEINTLTIALIFRPSELKRPEAEREARIEQRPDPDKRAKWRALLAEGADSALVDKALRRFVRLFGDMDRALASGPWLLGEEYSLADVGMTAYIDRLGQLQFDGLWASFPRVGDWLARVRARPSFAEAIGAYTSEERLATLKKAGEAAWPQLAPKVAALISERRAAA